MVTVRLFAAARAAAGTGKIDLAAAPLAVLLADLVARTDGALAPVLEHCAVVADGIRLDRADPTSLAPGAVLDVLPPFAGG